MPSAHTKTSRDNGLFITFEGGEGAGKTTQIKNVQKYLEDKGHAVITTREPGGTPEAEKIRDLLVQRDGGNWTSEAETLLFFTARQLHLHDLIWPALEEGKIVLCDRFTDSTRAYQSYGHDLELSFVNQLNDLVLDGFEPDLTFILDIKPEEGLKRSRAHLDSQASGKEKSEDRFEQMDIAFHERLHQGFLDIAKNNPDRCIIIDASQAPETISKHINETLDKHV